jgi:anaerobic selenocysteine-containing dehydrogenase
MEIYSKQLEEMGLNPLPVYEEPEESPFSKPELSKEYHLVLTTGAKLPIYIYSQMCNISSLRKLMPENIFEINTDCSKTYYQK